MNVKNREPLFSHHRLANCPSVPNFRNPIGRNVCTLFFWDIDNKKTSLFIRLKINSLAPPPQLVYASLEQARVAINAHQEGYAVAIRRTRSIGNRKDGDVKAVDIDCSRSHLPSIRTGPRHRILSSSRTGCLFKASVRRLKAGD